MARTEAEKAIIAKLANARREVVKAVDRAIEVDQAIGLREGHKREITRRLLAIRNDASDAMRTFGGKQEET